jgi:hypothetical protein
MQDMTLTQEPSELVKANPYTDATVAEWKDKS